MNQIIDNNPSKKPLLVLGIGNYLMGDEGLGVHFARAFEKKLGNHPQIDIVDGGTGGFHLMPWFEAYETVILVDATLDEENPGKINLIKPKFSRDFPRAMSTHDIGLKDVIEGMQLLGTMPSIFLFTVSIASVQPLQITLSPEIQNSLDSLTEHVLLLADELIQTGVNYSSFT